MRTSDLIIGILLIIMGVLFLSDNFGIFHFHFYWTELWPLLMILGGIAFWLKFYSDRSNFGLIIPGTILIIYGAMFLYCSIDGWYHMRQIWPGFLMGPGIGFFLMYILGQRDKGLLIPAVILTFLGIIFLGNYYHIIRFWPVLIIAAGVYLIWRSRSRMKGSA